MRILFALLLVSTQVVAQDLATPVEAPVQAATHTGIVAQTGWPNPHRITLLTESCGWPGGAMRAQWIKPDRRIEWGCWGYNETGVQIQWSTGRQIWVDYLELYYWDGSWSRQMGYQTLHKRVTNLKGIR